MKNFEIEVGGKKHWISRSVATVGVVLAFEGEEVYVLANKRGKGTPDYQGMWCCPCGYLDYGETTPEACSREIKEECGLEIDPRGLLLYGVASSPAEPRQNVTIRYCAFYKKRAELGVAKGDEVNEVDEVEWVPVTQLSEREWAFNHQYLITEILAYGREILQEQRSREETSKDVPEAQ